MIQSQISVCHQCCSKTVADKNILPTTPPNLKFKDIASLIAEVWPLALHHK
jgi:hypothetical protein